MWETPTESDHQRILQGKYVVFLAILELWWLVELETPMLSNVGNFTKSEDHKEKRGISTMPLLRIKCVCVCASLSSCFFIDMLCCLCMSFLHCRSCNLVFFWPPDCFMICVCSLCCFVLFVCCMEGTLSGSHLHFIPVTSRSHRITSLFPIHFAFQILPFLSIESLGNSDCKCNLKFTRINVAPLMGLLDAFRSSGCLLTFSCNPGIDETKSPKVGALLPSGKHAKSY